MTSATTAVAQPPNVVIVNIDDMGWGDLGAYGSPFSKTPSLDQLANQGTRLTQFYAGAPICSPSRATMFTGQYAARSNINSFLSATGENFAKDNANHLDLARPSMAKAFQDGGYATGHFGKWHLGGGRDVGYAVNPTPGTTVAAPRIVEYGYDTAWTQFEGLANRIINVVDYPGGNASGVTTRPSNFFNGLNSASDARGTGGGLDQLVYLEREYNAQFMVDRAIDFIDDTKQADPNKPFFMNVWLDEVHTPHDPPPVIVAQYNNDPQYAHLPQQQRNYLAVLEATDIQIGRLIDHIDNQGLGGETLILVTADNGAEGSNVNLLDSSGPFRGAKGDVFEGGVREPLIARWTGNVAANRTDTQTVMWMADLFPTLTSIAGVANPAGATFDGENLDQALLGNQSQTRNTSLFWNGNRGIEDRHSSPLAGAAGAGGQEVLALRSGNWKLVINAAGNTPELYDLATDTGESNNVALQQSAVATQLAQEALAIRYSTPALILPDSITPVVRLKAEDIAGLGNGAAVAAWNDSAAGDSVNGSVAQASAAARPKLLTGALNGRAVIEFDGVNDVLASSTNNSLPNVGEGITVFAVAASDPDGATAERLGQFGDNAGAAGQTIGFDLSGTTTATSDGGAGLSFNNGRALYDTPISGGGFHIVAWQVDEGQSYADATLLVDGTQPANTFTGSSNNPTGTTTFAGSDLELLLGTGRNGGLTPDDYYGGQLAEFVVFNDELTIGEINLVGNYFSTEYGLPFAYNVKAVDLFAIDGLTWNGGAANFDAAWNAGDGAQNPAPTNSDPFGNGGGEDLYLGNAGTATYNSATNVSGGTHVNSLRIGTARAGQVVTGTSGNGTLTASDAVNLTIGNGAAPVGAAETGNLTVGEEGLLGTFNWNSAGTLKVDGQFRVGQGGAGVVNQNDGVVNAGDVAGPLKFIAIGNGNGSQGSYFLNNGALRPGGGLTGPQLRHLRVGYAGAEGTLEVGDGVGAGDSARLESNDDLYVGYDGGQGVLRVRSDGAIQLVGNDAPVFVGLNNGSNGAVIQNGGTFTSDANFSIGENSGAVGSYVLSGGSLTTATDGSGEFRIGSNGGTGAMRIEATGSFDHGHALFVGHNGGSGATGRLEISGSTAAVQIAKLENAPGGAGAGLGVDETIRWEADAGGITPLIVDGAAGNSNFVQLQDPDELAENAGGAGALVGDGIALELDLSAITASMALTLIDNRTTEAIVGFFEDGNTGNLYEEGENISGTGYVGSVQISYAGGAGGNDVVLLLVAPLAGDFDNDVDVDGADFLDWQRQFPELDASDLADWEANFGMGPPNHAALSRVPEPTSYCLLLIAAASAAPIR